MPFIYKCKLELLNKLVKSVIVWLINVNPAQHLGRGYRHQRRILFVYHGKIDEGINFNESDVVGG